MPGVALPMDSSSSDDTNAILELSAVLANLFFFIVLGYVLRWADKIKSVNANWCKGKHTRGERR